MKLDITVHTIIKNEDRWIWYAIQSVLPYVAKIIIYDTGSSDKTLQIISTINSPKINLQKKLAPNRKALAKLRQEQIDQTITPWFMLVDGDEIWPRENLKKLITVKNKTSSKTIAFFTKTRNCVGDIYHYLPEKKGNYQIKDKIGHLNTRLIRKVDNLTVKGEYPNEAYCLNKAPIQDSKSKINFVDTWYLHTTHLPRSTDPKSKLNVIDRKKKQKFRFGIKMSKSQLPQVLFKNTPSIVPKPITNRWLSICKS